MEELDSSWNSDPFLEERIDRLIEDLLDEPDPEEERHGLFLITSSKQESLRSVYLFLSRFGNGNIGDLVEFPLSLYDRQILALLDESIYIDLRRAKVPFFSILRCPPSLLSVPLGSSWSDPLTRAGCLEIVVPPEMFCFSSGSQKKIHISPEVTQYMVTFLTAKLQLGIEFGILKSSRSDRSTSRERQIYRIEMTSLESDQKIYLWFAKDIPVKSIALVQLYLSYVNWPTLLRRLEVLWHPIGPNGPNGPNKNAPLPGETRMIDVLDILNKYLLHINQEPLLIF